MSVVAVATAGVAGAQQVGTITGTVTATGTATPLPGANVVIIGTVRSAVTNAQGQYRLTAPAGAHTVRARLIGYEAVERPVTVTAGETVTADLQLATSALALNEIVVTGSRTARSALETPVPVDVISAGELANTGHTEVNQILATLAPAFNASHQTIADGSDHINPASLRGLGPDQVLVLVNGKRRHATALVHVNGTFGRGTVGVDLNAIPAAAIERVEVLRDGAAAQYGSDAIAGVINIVLKEQTEQLDASTTVGITPGGGGFGDLMSNHDGGQVRTDLNYGFRVGTSGYFNVTGEFLDRGATNRAEPWSADIFPGITGQAATDAELQNRGLTRRDVTMTVGQAAATVGMAFFNGALPLSENAELYLFGGFSHRNGEAGAFYRLPNQRAQTVDQIFPNGFLPEIHTGLGDRSFSAGVRGASRGWDVDFSLTHGRNLLQYNIENTVNASLGAASPTTFDAGRLIFAQSTGNLDLVRPIARRGALKSLSLVLGGEFRVENYRIEAGDAASYQLGNGGTRPGIDYDTLPGGAPKQAGSQGFPGFQPANEVNRFRNSIGAYAGLETQLTERVMVDLAGRFENYSDFGNTVNWKVAGRYEITPHIALRGALSTGFRAPSLHQVWFNNVSTQFVVNPVSGQLEPRQVLTSNNQSRVTQAFGIPALRDETSVNASLGFTARPADNLSVTLDGYQITIDDRIVITSQFASNDPTIGARVGQILVPFQSLGVTGAQFFTNAVDTKTTGVDLVVAYARGLGRGTLNLTGSANLTKTEVERVHIPAAMATVFSGANLDTVSVKLLNREDRNRLEDALPRRKGTLTARYTLGRFSGLARATHYGEIRYLNPLNPANDERFGAKTLADLDFTYEVWAGLRLGIGGNNVFNDYPDRQIKGANINSGRFVYSRRVSQFGMNGGFYYARVQATL
ncbi:MAG: TonB-dependent receptor [Gemmatimonadales bacterium]